MRNKEKEGLCYRCEYRACYHEKGYAPRYECGCVDMAVNSCYMYQPVLPVILQKDIKTNKPRFAGALFSAREKYFRVAEWDKDLFLRATVKKNGIIVYWSPQDYKKTFKYKINNIIYNIISFPRKLYYRIFYILVDLFNLNDKI